MEGHIYCAYGNTKSKGVAILFHHSIQHEVVELIEGDEGRFFIKVNVGDETLVLVNCYFPTKNNEYQQCSTLKRLIDMLVPYADDSLIMGGDFNTCLRPEFEKFGGRLNVDESKKFHSDLTSMGLISKHWSPPPRTEIVNYRIDQIPRATNLRFHFRTHDP